MPNAAPITVAVEGLPMPKICEIRHKVKLEAIIKVAQTMKFLDMHISIDAASIHFKYRWGEVVNL